MLVAALLCFRTESPAPLLNAGIPRPDFSAVTPSLDASPNIPSAPASTGPAEETDAHAAGVAGNGTTAAATGNAAAAAGASPNLISTQISAHRVQGTDTTASDRPSTNSAAPAYVMPAAQIPLAFAASEQSGADAPGKSGAGGAAQSGADSDKDRIFANVQNDFVQAAQADTTNPSDPRYAMDWEKAQIAADEQLRAQIGFQAFNALQWQTSQVSSPSGSR